MWRCKKVSIDGFYTDDRFMKLFVKLTNILILLWESCTNKTTTHTRFHHLLPFSTMHHTYFHSSTRCIVFSNYTYFLFFVETIFLIQLYLSLIYLPLLPHVVSIFINYIYFLSFAINFFFLILTLYFIFLYVPAYTIYYDFQFFFISFVWIFLTQSLTLFVNSFIPFFLPLYRFLKCPLYLILSFLILSSLSFSLRDLSSVYRRNFSFYCISSLYFFINMLVPRFEKSKRSSLSRLNHK